MHLMNRPHPEREVRVAQAGREELAERVGRFVRKEGVIDLPGGLRLLCASSPTELGHGVSFPAFCMVAQGSKEVLLGDDLYRYDTNNYLITAASLPIASRITEASEQRPYVGVVLGLDPALVGSVMVEAGHPAPGEKAAVRAFDVSPLETDLLDAVLRLVRLLDAPAAEARFLRPLVTREIVFRLLEGEQSGRLQQIAVLGGHAHRIAGALERLREEFARPLRIEDVAREAGMSVSGFHHHFKAVTAMSPPAVPEADEVAGGPPPHARRGPRRRKRQPPRGVRRRLAVQPRVQEALRGTAGEGRGAAAGGRNGGRGPVSRSGTGNGPALLHPSASSMAPAAASPMSGRTWE
jgi:AraC-like DNA-binding protein